MTSLVFDPRHGKGQLVRLLDVVLIGPVMVMGGIELGARRPLGATLVLFGVATVVYNALNYARIHTERARP